MKIRTGFVSNSSSSSFVCMICEEVDSLWDGTLMDFDGVQCVNGHQFHINCSANSVSIRQWIATQHDHRHYNAQSELPEIMCPFCKFDMISKDDLLWYLLNGRDKEQMLEEIRSIYSDYKQFRNYL